MGRTKEIFNEERERESMNDDIYTLRDAVLKEEANALSAYVALKEMEKDLSTIIKQIQPLALDEAKTYEETSFDAYGAKISVKKGAGRWSFTHIPQWFSAKESLKEVEEKAKAAYNSKGFGLIVGDGGEVIEPAKYSEGSEQISVTIK